MMGQLLKGDAQDIGRHLAPKMAVRSAVGHPRPAHRKASLGQDLQVVVKPVSDTLENGPIHVGPGVRQREAK